MTILTPIAVLGAGSWGTALALYLARQGQPVYLWSHDPNHIQAIAKERRNNRYLPSFYFPETLYPTSELSEAIGKQHDILITTPSVGFRDTLTQLKPLLNETHALCWATKGLDFVTGHLLHEVAQEILGTSRAYAVLSGPSFAQEVAAGLPTAVVIASTNTTYANQLVQRFNSQLFRIYLSNDITGVEIGGIVKNVLAIAAGISDGIELGANARSALITRGIAEMMRLGVALGGKTETLIGLSGVGDIILTCTDNQSRNRRFGLALGQGKSIREAEDEIGQIIEGKRNAELIVSLAHHHRIEMPIAEQVLAVLQGQITVQTAIHQLLSRAQKNE